MRYVLALLSSIQSLVNGYSVREGYICRPSELLELRLSGPTLRRRYGRLDSMRCKMVRAGCRSRIFALHRLLTILCAFISACCTQYLVSRGRERHSNGRKTACSLAALGTQ